MHYKQSLTVPANTLKAALVTASLVLPAGVLEHIDIVFPPGCARMVHVDIKNGSTVVYPKGSSTDYCEDAYTVAIDDMVIFDAGPTLTIEGWSPGTTYSHVITVHAYIRTIEEIAMSRTGYY